MTLPDLDYRNATVEETEPGQETEPDTGNPKVRVFEIEYGPRDWKSTAIDEWIEDLLDEEFESVSVENVEKDRLYVDKEYADWQIVIEYRNTDEETYRVPLTTINAFAEVNAETPVEAVERVNTEFQGENITSVRNQVTVGVELGEAKETGVTEKSVPDTDLIEP